MGDASASIVFTTEGTGKVTDAAQVTAIRQALQRVSALAHVAAVVDPFKAKVISRDQRTALANVVYDIPSDKVTGAEQNAIEAAGRSAASAGIQVEFGGSAVSQVNVSHTSEIVAVGIAAFVLLITFGSLVAAGLPLVTAGVGIASSLFGIQIATRFFDLQSQTLTLALMLGLAVGIDYCLFVVSRYRHELITGRSGEDAAGRSVGTAGGAVLFAGLTVIIALSALAVVGIPFLTGMGLGAAGAVLAAVLVALTLLPAVLGFVGGRVLGRRGRAARDAEGDAIQSSLGERWGRLVTRFRIPVIAAIVIVLLVCALPALDLRLGMPNDASAPSGSTQLLAYEQTAKAFGPGFNGPLVVAVDLRGANDLKAAAAAIQKDVSALPGIAYVAPPTFNQSGNTAIVSVIPMSGPSDQATSDLVRAIRAHASPRESRTGAKAFVTGETAVSIDTAQKLQGALIPYLAVIVLLAFILLTIVFRSLLVPLKAVVGFLLSILATFGALVAVFQWGWLRGLIGLSNPGPILAFAPIFLIGILFGLAMDYEVFLVTRIREEHMRGDTANDAIAIGFRHGARVVTAAAVIMLSVFGGFTLQADPVIKTIAFSFAFGVFVDAFLVRMTFGPAVMSLLGERAWWLPSWLDRILPNVDIEGLGLPEHQSRQSSSATGHWRESIREVALAVRAARAYLGGPRAEARCPSAGPGLEAAFHLAREVPLQQLVHESGPQEVAVELDRVLVVYLGVPVPVSVRRAALLLMSAGAGSEPAVVLTGRLGVQSGRGRGQPRRGRCPKRRAVVMTVIKEPVTVEVAAQPPLVRRFEPLERLVHWWAAFFLMTALSGLTVGDDRAGAAPMRAWHLISAGALVAGLAVLPVLPGLRALLRTAASLAGPGPRRKFNVGQTAAAYEIGALLVGIYATGLAALATHADGGGPQGGVVALALIVLAGHVFLAVIYPSTRPALRGMLTGWVAASRRGVSIRRGLRRSRANLAGALDAVWEGIGHRTSEWSAAGRRGG